jgi:hypothetical protein
MVHHKYQYLFIETKQDFIEEDHISSKNLYTYNHDHIVTVFYHMVHCMDHDYMVQNINEYIRDVYIYMHTAKYTTIKYCAIHIFMYTNLFTWCT